MTTNNNTGQKSIWIFTKWSISSQIATISDLLETQTLCYLIGLSKPVSKIIGQICGAVVNCSVNYKWTFNEKDKNLSSLKFVALKYFFVWVGSLTFNTLGFTFFSSWLEKSSVAKYFDMSAGTCGFIAQLIVSLVVSIFWNFFLQRYFVYKNVAFKDIFNNLWSKIKRNEIQRKV